MSDNVTEITPMSVAADQEPERQMRTFRVLKWAGHPDSDENEVWLEVGTLETIYAPGAEDVGQQYGEGDFLLIEHDSKYDFHYVYPMRIIAEKRYRLAGDVRPQRTDSLLAQRLRDALTVEPTVTVTA